MNPTQTPKITHLGAKNHPKIRSNDKVKIKGIKEYESCSAIQIDPKTIFFSIISAPKLVHWGLKSQKGPQNEVKKKSKK